MKLTGNIGLVSLVGDQNVGRANAVLLGQLQYNRVGHQGRVAGAEWRVGGERDALRTAERYNVLLVTRSVRSEEDCQ